MAQLDGMPQAAKLILYADALATVFKAGFATFGLDNPGETTTLAMLADVARAKVLGDGTGTNVGVGSPSWIQQATNGLNALVSSSRYDVFYRRQCQGLVALLDTLVNTYKPSAWNFQTTSSVVHATDLWLTRCNALHPNTPATPTAAGTSTAVNNTNGALPNCVAGSAPRIVHSLVSTLGDQYESLPSAEATQAAITGANDAYSYQIAGTVPVAVGKVRIARGLVGGGAGVYGWDQDVSVTAGAAYPAILITKPDSTLRFDLPPPVWMSALMTPEFAALFALAYSSGGVGSPLGSNVITQSSSNGGAAFAANGMLSPINVLLGLASGFVGVGNAPSSAWFGISTLTGAATQTYSAGTIQTANNNVNNVQGFAGAAGLQGRVTTVLNGTLTPTISYTYLAAATGQTVQNATSVAGTAFSGTAVGSTSSFTVPAGRLVLSATVSSVAGTASSGAFLLEGVFPRSY